jgi:hypothetical protein
MEAPFDATKSKDDMFNFSGSASDMMAMMTAAGIVAPEAQEVESLKNKFHCRHPSSNFNSCPFLF